MRKPGTSTNLDRCIIVLSAMLWLLAPPAAFAQEAIPISLRVTEGNTTRPIEIPPEKLRGIELKQFEVPPINKPPSVAPISYRVEIFLNIPPAAAQLYSLRIFHPPHKGNPALFQLADSASGIPNGQWTPVDQRIEKLLVDEIANQTNLAPDKIDEPVTPSGFNPVVVLGVILMVGLLAIAIKGIFGPPTRTKAKHSMDGDGESPSTRADINPIQ